MKSRYLARSYPVVREPAPATGSRSGWLVKPADTIAPLLVYFGGNAEEVSWLIAMAHRFEGRAIALVNYRGYGESTGRPSEAALLADAVAVYDAFVARSDVNGTQTAVMGRSLGSGVAVHVAAHRAVDRVVLVSPYDSIAAVGAAHFPSMLVRVVLIDRYDSATQAPAIKTPLLAIAGTRDDIIPIEHSRRLYALWGGDKHWLELPGAGHNDLQDHPQYWPAIATFAASVMSTSASMRMMMRSGCVISAAWPARALSLRPRNCRHLEIFHIRQAPRRAPAFRPRIVRRGLRKC